MAKTTDMYETVQILLQIDKLGGTLVALETEGARTTLGFKLPS